MDDFLKSARITQEAIEIYRKVRAIPVKVVLKWTKWITSGDEVKSQIPETDRSTKVVKTFEAEPQSSSIFKLIWNVDTDSLIVFRGTEQEVPAKITPARELSYRLSRSVRPAWHMFTLDHKDAVSTPEHLGSNGASMGQKIVSRILKTIH